MTQHTAAIVIVAVMAAGVMGHGNNSSRGSSKSITGLYEREGQEE